MIITAPVKKSFRKIHVLKNKHCIRLYVEFLSEFYKNVSQKCLKEVCLSHSFGNTSSIENCIGSALMETTYARYLYKLVLPLDR